MTNKEFVLETMKRSGKLTARSVQTRSSEMTGTELNAEDMYIPDFKAAVKKANMQDRHAGMKDGFVCKSTAGRVVRLIQNYDSEIFTQEPEDLPAQFGFVWSKDPKKAKPFVALATSPYMKGDCCLNNNGEPVRSTMDNNTWSPEDYAAAWEVV